MENIKIGKLNFCIALLSFVAVIVWFKHSFEGIFAAAQLDDTKMLVATIIACVCIMIAVCFFAFLLVKTVVAQIKGKQFNSKMPFYALCVFAMALLVSDFVLMQSLSNWANGQMWFEVLIALAVLGMSLLALLFGGKVADFMGFVMTTILAGFFAVSAAESLIASLFNMVFAFGVLAAVFVLVSIFYAKKVFAPCKENAETPRNTQEPSKTDTKPAKTVKKTTKKA